METTSNNTHENRDPITGEQGAHPVGVGLGSVAGGMLAAAAVGTVTAGPVGTIVGVIAGAIAGAAGGKAVAERYDPTVEADHWRDNHAAQPFYRDGQSYEAYAPAYHLGTTSRDKYANKSFEEAEPGLAHDYAGVKGDAHVGWEEAKHATRAAWDRVRTAT